jgi:ribonuclease PH
VLTADGGIVEIQGTAEESPFSPDEFLALMELARQGTAQLMILQRAALGL